MSLITLSAKDGLTSLNIFEVSVFRRLLSLGIDPNFRDADGSTLLINSITAATRDCYFEVRLAIIFLSESLENGSRERERQKYVHSSQKRLHTVE